MNNPGIYIHFPFCKNKCNYCSFYSQKKEKKLYHSYIKNILRDLEQIDFFIKDLKPDTLYFGGGTPSLFIFDDLESIIQKLQKQYQFKEITLEANPATVTEKKLSKYKSLGINRISLGIQSFDNAILQFLGRIHSAQKSFEAIESVSHFFENYSIDIIYAIPSFQNVISSINTIKKYTPSHISSYALSIEENTPFSKKGIKICEEQFCNEYDLLHNSLKDLGYSHYEVSSFCLENKKSIHNEKYWERTSYIGIGPSAHSLWENKRFFYSDFDDFMQNDIIKKFLNASPLNQEEIREEEIMLGARTTKGINIKQLENKEKKIQMLQENNLLQKENERIILTYHGWKILNSIIVELL